VACDRMEGNLRLVFPAKITTLIDDQFSLKTFPAKKSTNLIDDKLDWETFPAKKATYLNDN